MQFLGTFWPWPNSALLNHAQKQEMVVLQKNYGNFTLSPEEYVRVGLGPNPTPTHLGLGPGRVFKIWVTLCFFQISNDDQGWSKKCESQSTQNFFYISIYLNFSFRHEERLFFVVVQIIIVSKFCHKELTSLWMMIKLCCTRRRSSSQKDSTNQKLLLRLNIYFQCETD